MDVEFQGLKNICLAAKKNKIKKIIYASTSGVYGKLNFNKNVKEIDPTSPTSGYAMAKRACEVYLENFQKESNIDCIVVRLFNVYGKKQDERMVIPRFVSKAKLNKDISIYGNGKQTRDFTHVIDCVKTFELLEKKVNGYKIFNSSKGKDIEIVKLAKIIKKLFNSKSKICLIKTPKSLQEFQVKKRCGDSSKLFKHIKFKPNIKLIDGLKEIYS